MKEDEGNIFSAGLAAGYAGVSVRRIVDRAGFMLEVSHVSSPAGEYHDEWAANRVGGGQELVETKDGRKFTRLYAGGTISLKELKKLGITKKDVTNYLKRKLSELKETTRLDADCDPRPDEDWHYSYKVISREESIPFILSREDIFYRHHRVFSHVFIRCPVE